MNDDPFEGNPFKGPHYGVLSKEAGGFLQYDSDENALPNLMSPITASALPSSAAAALPSSAAAAGFGSPSSAAGFGSPSSAAGFGSPPATGSPNTCQHGRRKDICKNCWQLKQMKGPTANGIFCKHGLNRHNKKLRGILCGDPECDETRGYTPREFVTHKTSFQPPSTQQGVIETQTSEPPIPNSVGFSQFTAATPVRRHNLFGTKVFDSSDDENGMFGGRKKYRKSKRKVRKSSRKSKRKVKKSSGKSKKLTKK